MKKLICLLFLVVLMSCQQSSTEPADSTIEYPPPISKERCLALFIDIHLAEAAIKNRQYAKDSLIQVDLEQLYTRVFEMHDINEKGFEELMEHFTHHPDQFEILYQKLMARLETELK